MSSTQCPICETNSCQVSLRKFNLEMGECPNCGLVFTTNVPANTDNRYGSEWFEKEYLPSFGINSAAPVTDHLAARFDADIDIVEKYVPKGRILDVGAGAGLFLNRAKQRGWEVFGIEPAHYGAEFAKRFFGIEMFSGLLKDAPLEPGSFDAVILQDVIEHVPDPKEVLRDVRKLLRPSGIVLITTPNYGSISRQIYRSNWALISPAEHLSLFRLKTLSTVLSLSDFKISTLNSTSELSLSRFHFPDQPWLKVRKNLLHFAALTLPASLVRRFALGDELVAVASAA